MSTKSKSGIITITVWVLVIAAALVPRHAGSSNDGRDLARRARAVLARRCFACHGLNGVARKNVFVLDRDRLLSSRHVVPGDTSSLLLKMVETGAMPMGGPELGDEARQLPVALPRERGTGLADHARQRHVRPAA